MKEFKQKGIFTLTEFENISSRSNTVIRPFQFAKLLEKLRIAAPFQMDGEQKYFFPCILAHTTENPVQHLMLTATPIPQLIVTFNCGYCPKGLPGALIKYLMANEMKSCYSWDIDNSKIFRNQVSFYVGPLDTFIIRITPTYLEIICIPNHKIRDRELRCPLSKVCCEVRKAVDTGIKQVTSDINYVNALHSFTFRCDCKGDHPGVLRYLDADPYTIYCNRTNEWYPLSPEHKLWQVKKFQVRVCPEYMLKDESCLPLQKGLPVGPLAITRHGSQMPCTEHQAQSLQQVNCASLSDQHQAFVEHKHDICVASNLQVQKLDENHHAVLLKQLTKHAVSWREIGTHLGFTQDQLETIQAKPLLLSGAPTSWLSKMLAEWLQFAPGDSRGSTSFATLEGLRTALNKAGLGATAHDINV